MPEVGQDMGNAERIVDKITSVAALVGFTFSLATDLRLISSPPRTTPPTVEVGWDPCMMWEQIPFIVKLAILYWLGLLLTLIVQGFRDRSAPRLLAIAGLIAQGIAVKHDLWFVTSCYTGIRVVGFWGWVFTSALLFLYHTLRRSTPIPKRAER